jgi:hypothetical protein
MSAVSDADVRTDAEAGVAADADAPGEGDSGAEDDVEVDGDGEGDGDEEAEGEAEGEGDALGCGDPATADAAPTTRWPGAICAEPVVTNVREPTEGGARAGTGAACPLIPGARLARVADAGT